MESTEVLRLEALQLAELAETRLRLLVEGLREYAIFFLSPEGRIEGWNSGIRGIFGYDEPEVLGRPFGILFTEDDRRAGADQKELATAREHGCADDKRYHLRKDGTLFWADGVVRTLYRDDGKLLGFAKLIRDDSKRKRDEDALRRQALVLEHMSEGVVVWDEQLKISFTNRAFDRMLGYESGELLGQSILTFSGQPETERAGRLHSLIAQLDAEGPSVTETLARRRDGTVFNVVFKTAMFSDNTYARQFITVAEDVTEKKRIEMDRDALNHDLARSNRDLEQFAYLASHDLQEPLRMISSYIALVHRRCADILDASAREYLGFALDGARRMQALTDNLLAYARIGPGPRERLEVNCNLVLRQVLSDLRVASSEVGAQIEVDNLPTLRGDANQLYQLFLNLIANALKFRSIRPVVITIHSAREGPMWRFDVRDNGIGLDMAHATKIFEIFRRLHANEAYRGTGIGLAICRKIVEMHGGRIWVESELDCGTTFRFTLPALHEAGAIHPGVSSIS